MKSKAAKKRAVKTQANKSTGITGVTRMTLDKHKFDGLSVRKSYRGILFRIYVPIGKARSETKAIILAKRILADFEALKPSLLTKKGELLKKAPAIVAKFTKARKREIA